MGAVAECEGESKWEGRKTGLISGIGWSSVGERGKTCMIGWREKVHMRERQEGGGEDAAALPKMRGRQRKSGKGWGNRSMLHQEQLGSV